MNGTHVVAELYRCTDQKMMTEWQLLRNACKLVIEKAKLTIVGEAWRPFPSIDGKTPGGVTGTLLLAESHLAIHTWPEAGTVTVDLYTCNVTRDNGPATIKAVQQLAVLLGSAQPELKIIARGSVQGE